jgi:hypothetical protein
LRFGLKSMTFALAYIAERNLAVLNMLERRFQTIGPGVPSDKNDLKTF